MARSSRLLVAVVFVLALSGSWARVSRAQIATGGAKGAARGDANAGIDIEGELHSARRKLSALGAALGAILNAAGSIGSHSINALVIDPHREREVYKAWQEIREEDERLQADRRDAEASGAYLNGPPLRKPPWQTIDLEEEVAEANSILFLNPRLAVDKSRCKSSGVLTFMMDGFSPDAKVAVYRSTSSLDNSSDGAFLPPSRDHSCVETRLGLHDVYNRQGQIARRVRMFLSANSDAEGRVVIDSSLRDKRMCDFFSYQAVDLGKCISSNVVNLSNSRPAVSTTEIQLQSPSLPREMPYADAQRLELSAG